MDFVPQYSFINNKKLNIVGVAVNEGQDLVGTELGPQALRDAGLLLVAKDLGWDINDLGDITNSSIEVERVDPLKYKYKDIKHSEILGAMCKKLYQITKKSAEDGDFTLVLGGDHGLATGSISGLKEAYPDLKIVWIDAHADCNIPEASPSGNYHGMPVAHLLGWIQQETVPGFDWLKPNLKSEDIVYIGLRDVDEFERKMLKKHNIKVFDMDDVTELGIGEVLKQTLAYLNSDGKVHPIHVSFDIDGCDPIYAPQTGTRARGGLTDREAHLILRKLAKTGNLVGMDLVEINPVLGKESPMRIHLHGDNKLIKGTETVCFGVELLQSALGYRLCM